MARTKITPGALVLKPQTTTRLVENFEDDARDDIKTSLNATPSFCLPNSKVVCNTSTSSSKALCVERYAEKILDPSKRFVLMYNVYDTGKVRQVVWKDRFNDVVIYPLFEKPRMYNAHNVMRFVDRKDPSFIQLREFSKKVRLPKKIDSPSFYKTENSHFSTTKGAPRSDNDQSVQTIKRLSQQSQVESYLQRKRKEPLSSDDENDVDEANISSKSRKASVYDISTGESRKLLPLTESVVKTKSRKCHYRTKDMQLFTYNKILGRMVSLGAKKNEHGLYEMNFVLKDGVSTFYIKKGKEKMPYVIKVTAILDENYKIRCHFSIGRMECAQATSIYKAIVANFLDLPNDRPDLLPEQYKNPKGWTLIVSELEGIEIGEFFPTGCRRATIVTASEYDILVSKGEALPPHEVVGHDYVLTRDNAVALSDRTRANARIPSPEGNKVLSELQLSTIVENLSDDQVMLCTDMLHNILSDQT